MTFSNWIELAMIGLAILIGTVLKRRSKQSVSDIEGSWGIVRESDYEGRAVGRYEVPGELPQ